MSFNDIDWRGWIGKGSTAAFIVAGLLSSIGTIAMGLVLITDMTQGAITGLPSMLGLLSAYVGILGLYPRLADRRHWAALAGVGLLLTPVVGIVGILAHAIVVGGEPPFVGPLFLVIMIGFALGITLFGATSYLTEEPSRGVGLALLAFAIPWFVRLGSLSVYGAEGPPWLDFVTTGVTAIALLAVGYLLWIEAPTTNREEPAPEPTA